jgi:hypothetical protein
MTPEQFKEEADKAKKEFYLYVMLVFVGCLFIFVLQRLGII